MTHLSGKHDKSLHWSDGSHRSTSPSTSGRVLARHEKNLTAHLVVHGERDVVEEWANAKPREALQAFADEMPDVKDARKPVILKWCMEHEFDRLVESMRIENEIDDWIEKHPRPKRSPRKV